MGFHFLTHSVLRNLYPILLDIGLSDKPKFLPHSSVFLNYKIL